MALTTSNVKMTAVKSFFEGMNLAGETWKQWSAYTTEDTPSLRIAALTGIDDISSWDGAADLTTKAIDSTGASTLSYAGYGISVQIGKFDVIDTPGIVQQASRKLGLAVGYKYDSLAYSNLNNCFSSATTADGKALFAADHTTQSGVARDNLTSAAFSQANLMDQIRKLRVFVNYQNQYTNYGDRPLVLIVHPKNEKAAIEALRSSFSADTALGGYTAMQTNALGSFSISLVVSSHMADQDDWVVTTADVEDGPFRLWSRSAPNYTIDTDEDNRKVKIGVDFACVAGLGPQPDGCMGANVA